MANKVIIIHGLNNNLECFFPLLEKLKTLGLEGELLSLPGHGKIRQEAKDFENAQNVFDQSMQKIIRSAPYSVIAFSQGALYLELWLEKHQGRMPDSQVLLAPALFIRHFKKLNFIMSKLPSFAFIISQMPKKLRRFPYLHIWEYRTLFNKAQSYLQVYSPLKVPTLILVDPKDELVDAQKLKEELDNGNSGTQIIFFERPYLSGRRPGKYHVLFHPDYFTAQDWDHFTLQISEFIKKSSRPEA